MNAPSNPTPTPSDNAPAQPDAPRPTGYDSIRRFGEFLLLADRAPGTLHSYPSVIRTLARTVGKDPQSLTEEEVRAYLVDVKRRDDIKPNSKAHLIFAIKSFYQRFLAVRWQLFEHIHFRRAKTLPAVLGADDVARLIAAVRTPAYRAAIVVAYACGLRIGEVVALTVRDIVDHGAVLVVRTSKNRSERRIPLPSWARDELRAFWLTHRHPDYLFPGMHQHAGTPDGKAARPLGKTALQQCMQRMRKELGLPGGTSMHTLRHSYATHLLAAGVSIRLISAYLGHNSIEATAIYTHINAATQASAVAAVEALDPFARTRTGR